MLNVFIKEHLGTLVVAATLALILVGLAVYLFKSRKSGGGCGCGCGCSGCPMSGKCHSKTDPDGEKRS